MHVAGEENVVRAMWTDKYDGERFSASAFKGSDLSVSRLAVISLDDHWPLFRDRVQFPAGRTLLAFAEINVSKLAALGRTHAPQITLWVDAVPLDWNPAHAEVRGNVTRGLANRILDAVEVHWSQLR